MKNLKKIFNIFSLTSILYLLFVLCLISRSEVGILFEYLLIITILFKIKNKIYHLINTPLFALYLRDTYQLL